MEEEKEIKKRLSVEISEEEHKEIKIAASERGITIKELIEDALRFYARKKD